MQHVLNLEQVAVKARVPRGLHRVETRLSEDVFDTLSAELSAYVLTERLASEVIHTSERVPVTWWDHAKQTYAGWINRQHSRIDRAIPEWWLRRHPVRHREIIVEIDFTRRGLRPESTIRFPDQLGPIVYHETAIARVGDEIVESWKYR